jgi:uncharacterized protein (DUF433 family)
MNEQSTMTTRPYMDHLEFSDGEMRVKGMRMPAKNIPKLLYGGFSRQEVQIVYSLTVAQISACIEWSRDMKPAE